MLKIKGEKLGRRFNWNKLKSTRIADPIWISIRKIERDLRPSKRKSFDGKSSKTPFRIRRNREIKILSNLLIYNPTLSPTSRPNLIYLKEVQIAYK